jgi:hypothetical protein
MASIFLLNRGTHKLVDCAAAEQRKVLMNHMVEPLTEHCHLLLIGVRVVGVILREVVESLIVLIDTP